MLLGILAWNLCAFVLAYFYYKFRNHQKAKKWDAMTPAEKAEYLATTTDEGNKRSDSRSNPLSLGMTNVSLLLRLDFRFAY